ARPHDHADLLAAQAAGRAAAVHGGVAAAQHDHPAPDPLGVLEGHRGQPVDADVDVGPRLLAAGNVEVAPAGRAAADEDRVETFREQPLHGFHALAGTQLDAEVEDVADLLVDDGLGQAEMRDLAADEAARLRILLDDRDVVAERQQVAGDRERRRAGADAGDPEAVRGPALRQPRPDVLLEVGGHALEPADRHRLGATPGDFRVLDATAPAGRFTGPVAGPAENAGENVGPPVDHVRIGVAPLRDQADVFGNWGVCRTCPLAIDDLVEVSWIANIRGSHYVSWVPGPGKRGPDRPPARHSPRSTGR